MEKRNKALTPKQKLPSRKELIEGEHYYINSMGYWVFTEKYHLLRGYCCENGCLHCPYGNSKKG
ncbi:MAG: DUF5522 domain-containing protein [Bacteroidota bacterium]